MKEKIWSFLEPASAPPFVVEMVGISYCDGTYRQSRHGLPLCVAEYVEKGTGTVIVDGKTYTASAGDVYIIPPGSRHTYYSDADDPWVKWFINAHGRVITPLLEAYGLTGQAVFPACPVAESFHELIRLAAAELPAEEMMKRCCLTFHEILMGVSASRQQADPLPEDAVALKNRIDADMSRVLSIGELAAGIYRSTDYVIKLFRRCYGETPYAYATKRKVQAACRLLTDTHLPVNEIAGSLGYADARYFAHIFRRHMGISPTAYRRKQRED